jgi:hypothetical protein
MYYLLVSAETMLLATMNLQYKGLPRDISSGKGKYSRSSCVAYEAGLGGFVERKSFQNRAEQAKPTERPDQTLRYP